MSESPSGLDIAGILGGAVTIMGAIGTCIRYLFTRADRRAASLERKEAELVSKLENRIKLLEERDQERDERDKQKDFEFQAMRTELHDTRAALMIVATELHTNNPKSPALHMARRLLRDRFPLDPETPSDMVATLGKIE